ncbi:hypothetical protein [Bradyrhizobium sp.]|uniref:hypothetical protein n=1 Tax=Bradyrhizobium sp. TaxID=376 RepID=UPI0034333FB3
MLALLFILDAALPKPPVADGPDTAVDLTTVRIHSDRKWPERVVFDTSVPAAVPATVPASPAQIEANVSAPAIVADISAGARVRDVFAQFVPAYPKKPELKPQQKRKTATSRLGVPMVRVAQQPRFGFLANDTW